MYEWPSDVSKLRLDNGLLVIAIRTSLNIPRVAARQQIRIAIQEVLASLLNCVTSEIQLSSQAGQAIKLVNPSNDIGLSISHDPGLSLAAMNMNGPIGVDLMATESIPELGELATLATEYLGEKVTGYILNQPVEERKITFAKAWVTFEASMKLKGLAINECSVARDALLKNIKHIELDLATGYIGAVAY